MSLQCAHSISKNTTSLSHLRLATSRPFEVLHRSLLESRSADCSSVDARPSKTTSLSCRHHHAFFPVEVVPVIFVREKGCVVYFGPGRMQVGSIGDFGCSSGGGITCCGLGCPNDSVTDIFSGLETALPLSSGDVWIDCSSLLYRDDEAVNDRWRDGEVGGCGAMNGGDGGFGGTVCCRRKSCWAAANRLGAGALSCCCSS
jgi:hypothetical protein